MNPKARTFAHSGALEMITLRPMGEPDSMPRRICAILEARGVVRQARLVEATGMRKGSVSKYLAALAAEGYVRRVNAIVTGRGTMFEWARTARPLPETVGVSKREASIAELMRGVDAMVRSAR